MKIGFYIDAKIGDSVVALPAMRAIKHAYPQSKLFVFTNEIGCNLYAPLLWIDQIEYFKNLDQISSLNLDYLISSNDDKNMITKLKHCKIKTIITYLKFYNLFDPQIKSIFKSYRFKPQNAKQNCLDLVNCFVLFHFQNLNSQKFKTVNCKHFPTTNNILQIFSRPSLNKKL